MNAMIEQHQSTAFEEIHSVYDVLMDDVDYQGWHDFIVQRLGTDAKHLSTIVDLGCGTGSSLLPFQAEGQRLIGVDVSQAMLKEAARKLPDATFICSDFQSMELPTHLDLVVALFDTFNFVHDPQQLQGVFNHVYELLRPGGHLVFDMNTTGFLKLFEHSGTGTKKARGIDFTFQGSYEPLTRLASLSITWTDQNGTKTETHVERAYDPDEIMPMLKQAGFHSAVAVTFPEGAAATADSERIHYFAHK